MTGLLFALGLLSSLVQADESDGVGASDAGAAPVPSLGAALQMAAPAKLQFEVDTTAGPIKGTLSPSAVIARGLSGTGQFELVCEFDPLSLHTGDDLRDRMLHRQLFGANPGALRFAAYTRVGAEASAEGSTPMATAMGFWQTPQGRTRLDVPYAWSPADAGGTLTLTLVSTWAELGLPEPAHPFVRVTGPVRVTLQVPLSK